MPFTETHIPGLILFEPQLWEDERGYFFEAFNAREFEKAGISADFVQDNQAKSTYGVLRGLHYQVGHHAQAKLVRVLEGEVFDVAVDLREGSPSYGQWFGVALSERNKKQLFVPKGFAHGYSVLSPSAVFFYKCDQYYNKSQEGGIRYDDPNLNIDWRLPDSAMILSPKDLELPYLGSHRTK
ncbi:MAG: dTDP-4-dehydrorhamnose 3,5-epimerase [Haliscomenobacter sp.]|nr:dTDP-4-dehydrorhamnose 3,5-epimerase [Haliscomenobacter sp.]MBK8880279.1 dTDP-4-dehydrorhamnose 3,5-epimerase [Haliscomenobacter sp.]